MTSFAPPKPTHDCAPFMEFAGDVCWCKSCGRTWVIGPRAWEPVPAQHARAARQRAMRERSNAS